MPKNFRPPTDIEVLKVVLAEYHTWLDVGAFELHPKALEEELRHPVLEFAALALGLFVHIPLWFLRLLSLKLRFWPGVRWFSKLRILTDNLSFEPAQCGLNVAYTFLGRGRLKRGDVPGAISALRSSGLVWPCPHNTSFGLRTRLAKELEPYPEAEEAVREYRQLAKLFRG